MEEELVEHIVDIDQYVSVTLKIPKVMTALELKGLTMKANKLFNLAEVPIVEKKKYNTKPKHSKVNGWGWNKELEKELVDLKDNKNYSYKQLAEHFGKTEKQMKSKIYNMKRLGRWNK